MKQIHEKNMLFALFRHSVKKEILLSRIFREINFSLNNLTQIDFTNYFLTFRGSAEE